MMYDAGGAKLSGLAGTLLLLGVAEWLKTHRPPQLNRAVNWLLATLPAERVSMMVD